ncbi:MAG: hypothetical protein ACOX5J_00945 [Candidatus Hydrogenedentales bacterium]|jgi:hypothetical protein
MNPTLSVNVNLCNPGQVFGCCGLFELAHRLTPSDKPALGWFDNVYTCRTLFCIEAHLDTGQEVTLGLIRDALGSCRLTEGANKDGPLQIGSPFELRLDWRTPFPQNSLVKAWALTGKSVFIDLVRRLFDHLPKTFDAGIFESAVAMKQKATRFDPSHARNALDAGFSYNLLPPSGKKFSIHVATELLSLIGLQRFCPSSKGRNKPFIYYPWQDPLPVALAAVAVSIPQDSLVQKPYEFRIYNAGSDSNPSKAFDVAHAIQHKRSL